MTEAEILRGNDEPGLAQKGFVRSYMNFELYPIRQKIATEPRSGRNFFYFVFILEWFGGSGALVCLESPPRSLLEEGSLGAPWQSSG